MLDQAYFVYTTKTTFVVYLYLYYKGNSYCLLLYLVV